MEMRRQTLAREHGRGRNLMLPTAGGNISGVAVGLYSLAGLTHPMGKKGGKGSRAMETSTAEYSPVDNSEALGCTEA